MVTLKPSNPFAPTRSQSETEIAQKTRSKTPTINSQPSEFEKTIFPGGEFVGGGAGEGMSIGTGIRPPPGAIRIIGSGGSGGGGGGGTSGGGGTITPTPMLSSSTGTAGGTAPGISQA